MCNVGFMLVLRIYFRFFCVAHPLMFYLKNNTMIYKLLAKVFVFSLFTLALTNCASEGPMGPEGIPGRNGSDGQNGKDGNATIYSSIWYTPNDWLGQSKDWYFDITSTSITKSAVEGGVILAYVSLPNDIYKAAVRPLPCYATNANWDFLIPDYGKIEFTCDSQYKPVTSDISFRYIVIPAGYTIQATLKAKGLKTATITDLKAMSYTEVCKTLSIAE